MYLTPIPIFVENSTESHAPEIMCVLSILGFFLVVLGIIFKFYFVRGDFFMDEHHKKETPRVFYLLFLSLIPMVNFSAFLFGVVCLIIGLYDGSLIIKFRYSD